MSNTETTPNETPQLNPDPKFKIEKGEGAKLNDESFGNLLNVIAHCAFETFDGLVPFDEKSDEEKEELIRIAMKSMEIAAVISCKFFDSETFEADTAKDINDALKAKDFEKANVLLGKM